MARLGHLVDLKAATTETLIRHIVAQGSTSEDRRELRKLAGEFARRLTQSERRRQAFSRRISAATMVEYRLDREVKAKRLTGKDVGQFTFKRGFDG